MNTGQIAYVIKDDQYRHIMCMCLLFIVGKIPMQSHSYDFPTLASKCIYKCSKGAKLTKQLTLYNDLCFSNILYTCYTL